MAWFVLWSGVFINRLEMTTAEAPVMRRSQRAMEMEGIFGNPRCPRSEGGGQHENR